MPNVWKMRSPKKNLAFKSRETAPRDRSSCDLAAWGARSCSCLSQRQKLLSVAEGWSCGQPLLPSPVSRSITQPLLTLQSCGDADPFCHAQKHQPEIPAEDPALCWVAVGESLPAPHFLPSETSKENVQEVFINSVILHILCMWIRLSPCTWIKQCHLSWLFFLTDREHPNQKV